jgi:alpha-ketoglutarate-dependent taurine dioxygenase
MNWHADLPNYKIGSYPFRALWAIKKPQNNSGITQWLNIEDCFNVLDPKLKELAKRITLMQQNWHRFGTGQQMCEFIKTQPVTGKQSLRLNFYATEKEKNAWIVKVFVDNKPLQDCSLIQEYIDDLLKYKELFYAHNWDIHDIAIYDNHSFVHNRTSVVLEDNEENNERRFYRTNIDHMTDFEFQNIEFPAARLTSTIK